MSLSFKDFDDIPDPAKKNPQQPDPRRRPPRDLPVGAAGAPEEPNLSDIAKAPREIDPEFAAFLKEADIESLREALDRYFHVAAYYATYVAKANPALDALASDFTSTFVQQRYPNDPIYMQRGRRRVRFSIEPDPKLMPTAEDFAWLDQPESRQ